jgi:hypothetical protein
MYVDRIQPPPGLPSPCTVQYPHTDARAHDPTTIVSTLPPDSYSVIQGQFCNATWRHAGELEPKDPTTGRSVLHALLEECTNGSKGRISKCRLCNRTFSRADRAITHLRHKHLDHRPFSCGGACGTKGWCDNFPVCLSWTYLISPAASNAFTRKRIWPPILSPRWCRALAG